MASLLFPPRPETVLRTGIVSAKDLREIELSRDLRDPRQPRAVNSQVLYVAAVIQQVVMEGHCLEHRLARMTQQIQSQ
jgi:hypothetical protein